MSPSDAMHSILTATGVELAKKGGSLLKNCVRTWLFVRDIDMEYAGVVKGMFDERFPDIPFIILHASVCRPGWLVEMECMAMRKR